MADLIIIAVCIAGLIFGSVTDIRKREVPDWVSFGLIFAGIGLNLLLTIIKGNLSYIINSIAGLLLMYLFALLMYYTGQWGGGDSKVLMGIGALAGFEISFPLTEMFSSWLINPYYSFPFLVYFIIFTMFFGSVYGLIWSLVSAVKKYKDFKKEFLSRLKSPMAVKIKFALIAALGFILFFAFITKDIVLRFFFLAIGLLIALSFYLLIYIKTVEKVCMVKKIMPNNLTEGDWIAEEVKTRGRVIAGPKDLGIEKEQIEKLISLKEKGKIKYVLVKEGIPFVPSFLIGFIAALIHLFYFTL